ncbi:hypothetical protein HCN44_005525 [Aphidius gifuensis]|uniref:Uncharacterized protein n=1 Tax=Aphidius gifuensis TaxID=684658 RepID=A0A835CX91_APHGI|nr:hypothetical protein HCN44_005525 [Aphidius gifuensis]
MQIFLVCLVPIGTNFMVTYGAPLDWDNVPLVSQGKMFTWIWILTTCTLGGFIIGSVTGGPVGGSAGAVGGSLVADGTSTFLYNKPMGMIDHALHLEKKTTGEHIDAALDLTFTAVGPQVGKSTVNSSKKKISLKLERPNPRQVSITSSEVEAVFSNPSYKNTKPSTGSESYADILIKLDSEEQNRQRQMKG